MPFDLSGKVAAVTGAGSGIGQSIAELFARQGAHVHLLDIDAEGGEGWPPGIRGAGHAATFRRCDVASEGRHRLLRRAVRRLGRLDILVNNAGVSSLGHRRDDPRAGARSGLRDQREGRVLPLLRAECKR